MACLPLNSVTRNPPLVGVYQIYLVDSSSRGISKDRIEAIIRIVAIVIKYSL
jgi:hypothetical protein